MASTTRTARRVRTQRSARPTLIDGVALALVAGGVVLLRAATAPHDWMAPAPTTGDVVAVVVGSLACGLGLALAIDAVARRRAPGRAAATLPAASVVGAAGPDALAPQRQRFGARLEADAARVSALG